MRWRELAEPVRMQRIALVSPAERARGLLVRVADAGVVELDAVDGTQGALEGAAAQRVRRLPGPATPPRLSMRAPDLDELERSGRLDLLAGEAQLEERAAAAVRHRDVTAFTGWAPAAELPGLGARLREVGGAAVPLPPPPGIDPPTLLRSADRERLPPIVDTYATIPYADVDPTTAAAVAYVVMFGMMFADAGHGALLVAVALLVRAGLLSRLQRYRQIWSFLAAAGGASIVFGVLYGEFFGPTTVLPTLWLAPLDRPVALLVSAVAVGALLLAGAFALGTVNRRREGGWRYALYQASGLAGSGLFLALGLLAGGWYLHVTALLVAGVAVSLFAVAATFVGLRAEAGPGSTGGMQAAVELFDTVVRLGSNLLSFARLAAFGLTHAALGMVVWRGTTALWHQGGGGWPAAVALFAIGNVLTFALEALVAGVQALRLEYYELFSRVFRNEGRPFRPWHVPAVLEESS